jgi:hypothetical protein
MANEIQRLVRWYREKCDGDWEHQYRIRIGTIDNPGWSLKVNVSETSLAGRTLALSRMERSEVDWIFHEVKNDEFQGHCGPDNLVEMIGVFLLFAGVSDP